MEFIAAPFTPFDTKGHIDLSRIDAYAQYLKAEGLQGAFVNGTTGECMSLTAGERQQLFEAWLAHRNSDFKIILHVGSASSQESMEMSSYAESKGVDAIASVAPFYGQHNMEQVARHLQKISMAAPKTKLYYYHIPCLTGVTFKVEAFLKEYASTIPTLAGVKFTHEDLMDYSLSQEMAGVHMYFGREEIFSSGLMVGAKGCVGSTFNYMKPVFDAMVCAFAEGELERVRQLQIAVLRVIEPLYKGGFAAGKAYMKIRGQDLGFSRLSPHELNSSFVEDMKQRLDAAFALAGKN